MELHQDAYNSGKPGNLREFVNSGKLRANSGNLKYTQGIFVFQMLFFVTQSATHNKPTCKFVRLQWYLCELLVVVDRILVDKKGTKMTANVIRLHRV